MGTWIDGEKIYRRVFTGVITQSVNQRNITNINIGAGYTIVGYGGRIHRGNDTYAPIPTLWTDSGGVLRNYTGVTAITSGGNIELVTQFDTNRTNAPYQLVIDYTKP